MATPTFSAAVNTSPYYGVQLRRFALRATLFLFTVLLAMAYLMPFANMALTAVKSQTQIADNAGGSILPLESQKVVYQGKEYPVYKVPFEDGSVRELALVKKGREVSQFADPQNLTAELISWKGNWRGLETVSTIVPHYENFTTAWEAINFPLLFRNTLLVAITGMIGTLLSSICVAYAFARFPIPGKNILFIILIGTIILPSQVTLIPTYSFFSRIGWVGTWLPLIVPHFFANAYNVFLLRQFFMTLPRELDEAAMIDGAGPFRILTHVIIPQSWPAILSVGIFHFVFAWNDYFNPLIYLIGKPDLQVISVGVQVFNFQYGPRPELIQATSLMALVLPVVIFFLAQGVFMRGVVITGVEK